MIGLEKARSAYNGTEGKHTSPETPPDAKRVVWMGLKSSPRIGPV